MTPKYRAWHIEEKRLFELVYYLSPSMSCPSDLSFMPFPISGTVKKSLQD